MNKRKYLISLFFSSYCFLAIGQSTEQVQWLQSKSAEKEFLATSFSQPDLGVDMNENRIKTDHPGDPVNTPPPPKTQHTFQAATTISANDESVTDNNGTNWVLDGEEVHILLIDAGRPRTDHDAFQDRVCTPQQYFIDRDPAFPNDPTKYVKSYGDIELAGHANYAASSMIANPSDDIINAEAIAPASNANLISLNWDFPEYDLADYAAKGINLVCVPWGYLAGWTLLYKSSGNNWYWFGGYGQAKSYLFGYYGNISKKWDEVLYNSPYTLVVKSAGNDFNTGPGSEYTGSYIVWNPNTLKWEPATTPAPEKDGQTTPTVTDIAVSKNVLTIAGLMDSGVKMEFSNIGPTLDNRIKPDVAANGDDLYVANTCFNNYSSGIGVTGTSFAASSATGGIALLLQAQKVLYGKIKFLASTTKALVIHTAQRNQPAPDVLTGYGTINIGAALAIMEDNASVNEPSNYHQHIHEFVLSPGAVVRLPIKRTAGGELKATICWTDPAPYEIDGTDIKNIGEGRKALVNDVDLRIYEASETEHFTKSTAYFPFRYSNGIVATGDNTVDNVEQVIVPGSNAGTYIVEISSKTDCFLETQQVSLIVTGNEPTNHVQQNITIATDQSDEMIYKASGSIAFDNPNGIEFSSDAKISAIAPSVYLKRGFHATNNSYFRATNTDYLQGNSEILYLAKEFNPGNMDCRHFLNEGDCSFKSVPLDSMSYEKELKKSEGFISIYPNPVHSTLFINFPDDDELTRVQIVDVMGREVYLSETTVGCSHEVDMENFRSGIYQVRVQTNKSEYKQLIVKK